MKKSEQMHKPKGYKRLFASRLLVLAFLIFTTFVLIVNEASLGQVMLGMVVLGALFVGTFIFTKTTGVLLILLSVIVGVATFPLRHYGSFALIQCLLLLVAPPFLAGICFLKYGTEQQNESNQNTHSITASGGSE